MRSNSYRLLTWLTVIAALVSALLLSVEDAALPDPVFNTTHSSLQRPR